MRFKFKNADVKISFSLFAVIVLSIVYSRNKIYIYSFVSSIIHEFVHIILIKAFHSSISEVSLSIFGGNIKRKNNIFLSNYKEALISFSAPFVNLVIGFVTLYFGNRTSIWGAVNLFLGAFNMLPFYSFDGGRALFYLLTIKLSERTVDTIITLLSVIITVAFSFWSVYIFIFNNNNYFLLIVSSYMILCMIFNKK